VPQDLSFEPPVVRAIVRGRGMTLRAFAKEIGVHPVTVNGWLSGWNRPSAKNLRRVNDFLASTPPSKKNGEVG
jgi:transcriptional regulator with XRE-family HTH domain